MWLEIFHHISRILCGWETPPTPPPPPKHTHTHTCILRDSLMVWSMPTLSRSATATYGYDGTPSDRRIPWNCCWVVSPIRWTGSWKIARNCCRVVNRLYKMSKDSLELLLVDQWYIYMKLKKAWDCYWATNKMPVKIFKDRCWLIGGYCYCLIFPPISTNIYVPPK